MSRADLSLNPARWSLQRRLVVGIVVLLAVVSVVDRRGERAGAAPEPAQPARPAGRRVRSDSRRRRHGSGRAPDGRRAPSGRAGSGACCSLSAGGQSAGIRRRRGRHGGRALTTAEQQALLALPTSGREAQTVDLGGSLGSYRVATRDARRRDPRGRRAVVRRGQRHDEQPAADLRAGDPGGSHRRGDRRHDRGARSPCARSAGSPRRRPASRNSSWPRARSRSPTGFRRPTPTRTPRSARWARPSTACSGTSRARWSPVRPARTRCASSSRMPATSCARRSRRSADTPS